jgi:hypothetical protein
LIVSILGALWRVIRRDAKSLGSFSTNNFFVVGIAALFLGDPGAFVSLNVVMAVVLFFPLSTDPLRKIPPSRLALWPLTDRQKQMLRVLSPWLNPITWLLAGLALWKSIGISVWVMVAGLFVLAFVVPAIPRGQRKGLLRWLPNIPGRLNQLLRKDIREEFSTLDFYSALLWSVPAALLRFTGRLPAAAFMPITVIILLALSTNALSLFGLDGRGGMTRYRLLPLPGWQILAAKDAAFLAIVLVLTAPLAPLAGLGGALVALAIGHYDSVTRWHNEVRWRFSTSASLQGSIVQILAMIAAGASVVNFSRFMLVPCIAAYGVSTWWFGQELDKVRG